MYQAARIAKSNLAKHREFRVGVYLETNSYGVSAGNIQHTNDRLTLCAEMLALAQAKSNGLIPKHLHLVSDSKEPIFPCGVCRQYASEFPTLKVTTYSSDGSKKITKTIKQLFPNPFERQRF
jgi:cytidine deaminase